MSDQAVHAGSIIATTHAQDQSHSIPYRPQYTRITGKVAASILLQQISYWSHIKEGKPFYKFRAPCAHDWYKDGDSWTEELGMTPGGFDTALKAIGAKVTKGKSKSELLKSNLVIYWTDNSRVTWYQLNERLFYEMLHLAYNEPELLGKSGFRNWLGKRETATFLYSETTPETTQRHVATATPAPASPQPRWPVCKKCGNAPIGDKGGGLCDSCYGDWIDATRENARAVLDETAQDDVACHECKRPGFTADEMRDDMCPACYGEMVDGANHENGVFDATVRTCGGCGKLGATTADMPDVHNTCTCKQESALVDTFGKRPQREPQKPVEHWTVQAGKAWAQWGAESDEFQRQLQRFGDSGRIVQELGYKLQEATGLKPLWGTPKKVKWWSSGLWELYEEAGHSIPVAIEAVRAMKANKKLTAASPYSFMNTARALAASKGANGGPLEFTV